MNDSYENTWIENYFDIIREHFADPKYSELVAESFDLFRLNSNPPFVFCLSASKDVLSQWRAYSQDGQGVSIGFSTKDLKLKNELPSPNVSASKTLGIAKVEYYRHSQRKKVLELCKAVEKSFEEKTNADDRLFLSMDLAFTLVDWAMVFKNSSFSEEREWRIVHTPASSYEEQFDRLSELKFRLKLNRITTYYEYYFGSEFNANLIKAIVLGPKCRMTRTEVEQFLSYNNLESVHIVSSKSTYA